MLSQSSEATNDCELNVSTQWQNLSLYNGGKTSGQNEILSPMGKKALLMMQKMGYKSGSGLGKNEQGITKAVELTAQLGKRGFGLNLEGLKASDEEWDFSKEEIVVNEKAVWLESPSTDFNFSLKKLKKWTVESTPITDVSTEDNFCDPDLLNKVLEAKNIFDELNLLELTHARAKANPFETVRSVFFMNRAALKMANIDAATDFMFTSVDQNIHHSSDGPFYFADVCAGPGGFTEYILWRKKWNFKGFGLTLKDENDFKVSDSLCASPCTFQALYGSEEDGNVCNPDNIRDFRDKVLNETDATGVHFMTSDGGFSVEGNENLQEVLSKNIYICQCLVALEILREHGHFVTKVFDLFTPFSVGLLYLMYLCFEKVSILKPNTSRPANSERYFICSNLKDKASIETIRNYLWHIVNRLWELQGNILTDIVEIVPINVIKTDKIFFDYIVQSNNSLARKQIIGLEKLAAFCRNPGLVEVRQEDLRKKCLHYWKIPDKPKVHMPKFDVDDLLSNTIDKPEILLVQPREVKKMENLEVTITDLEDWHYCPMYCSKKSNNCNFYVGVGSSKVYRLQRSKWVKVKNMQLVKGTMLYGEFVKEKITYKTHESIDAEADTFKYSLHVIDALRLGDRSLADLRFNERLKLIKIYCKSVNKECENAVVRIRPKPVRSFMTFASDNLVQIDKQTGDCFMQLSVLGFRAFKETVDVNSILILKTNDNQSFHSTYVLRVQIFINKFEDNEECISINSLLNYVKEKL